VWVGVENKKYNDIKTGAVRERREGSKEGSKEGRKEGIDR